MVAPRSIHDVDLIGSTSSMALMLFTRLARLAATLFAVTLITFSMVSLLPGDPVDAILGQTERTPEIEEELRQHATKRGAFSQLFIADRFD